MGMATTGAQLIGHNAALQEHWIKRVMAIVIDFIIVLVLFILLGIAVPGGLLRFGVWWTLLLGFIWVPYAVLFEASSGRATIGKRAASLQVVATAGVMNAEKAVIRNISKLWGPFLLIDWVIGLATHGDPRQRYLDRVARTSVTRVDAHAYIEEQFRQMQYVPPHPTPPPVSAWGQPAPTGPQATTQATMTPPKAASAHQATAAAGEWPGQQAPPAGSAWPQHRWDQGGNLVPQMRFCTACGGQLVQRGDGKVTCVRCGAVY
ncbi:MAG: hypothetical protein E6K13_09285 [Methanobacteriota archaeon]|nr:MAG: hypothetical protein E6K13_09285 [Euryarchaeota archaeon]